MSSPDMSVRAARILSPDTVIRTAANGDFYARSPHPLGAYPDTLTERLDHWAAHAPERTFLASRDADGGWRRLTYAAAHRQVRSVAESLLERRLSADRPVLILSGNGLEHAVLAMAAMYVGVPYAPVAPAYSLLSKDFQTLGAIWASMQPGLVFADDGQLFERALASQLSSDVEIVTLRACPTRGQLTLFDDLLANVPTA